MTKFNIQTADLKYIIESLKPAVSRACSKIAYQCIKFECKSGTLSAFGTDGYRIHSVSVHIDITGGEDCFSFLLKPFTIPHTESTFIPCELSEKEIMFNFGDMKITYKICEDAKNYLDINAAIPKEPAVFRIAFNPKYLVDAAKTLKSDSRTPAILELRSPMTAAILYNEKDKSDYRLILPVRMRSNEGWGTAFPERNQSNEQ